MNQKRKNIPDNKAVKATDIISLRDFSKNDILVVDDNISNLKLVRTLLREKGIKVRVATNGSMALDSAFANPPSLILLDISMPGMSGFDVCRKLKREEITRDIPVIFLSALKEEFDIVQGFACGGVDFITKPFKAEILLSRIYTHLTISELGKSLHKNNLELEERVAERAQKIIDTNNKLRKSEARLKFALTASNEGIWDWDLINDEVYFSDAYFTMLGFDTHELSHTKDIWQELLHPKDLQKTLGLFIEFIGGDKSDLSMTFRLRNKNGGYCWIQSKSIVVKRDSNNQPERIVGTHTDITLEKITEDNLKRMASYDTLTDLPNRKYFVDLLEKSIARAKRKSRRHAVLFLDLDRFKNINDSLGHSTGDKLLIQVAHRLSEVTREGDTVARIGGDEFSILLQEIDCTDQVTEISNRIIEVMQNPFDLQGHRVVISPSIGIVLYPDHAKTPEDLLKKADTAMYHAKRAGGNNYWFFTNEMKISVDRRLQLEEELRYAMENDEIFLNYQPKVSFKTGEIIGMEALARWQRNDSKMVPPNEFIPIAEETGLIIPLGEDILYKAIRDAKRWNDAGLMTLKISVNISARQFSQEDLPEKINRALQLAQLSPEQLELEITEAAAMENLEISINFMEKIKNYGITLAMDDFGTGYSSLSYLKKFPLDCLKVDQSFIRDMEKSEVNKNIVETVINLAHNLNLEVVAEGVETQEQVTLLAEMGCDTLQGYFFSKPILPKEVEQLLKSNKNLYAKNTAK